MGAFGVSWNMKALLVLHTILSRPIGAVEPFFYHYPFRSGICLPEIRRRSYGIMDMRLRLYFDRFGDMAVPVPPIMSKSRSWQRFLQTNQAVRENQARSGTYD